MAGDFIDKAVTYSGGYGSKHPLVMPERSPQKPVYDFWDEFPVDIVVTIFIIIVVMLVIGYFIRRNYHD